nr:PAS domain S-box protein [Kineosporia babensis]
MVKVASSIARTPSSTITMIDEHRQWFKAAVGMANREGDRKTAFCDRVVADRAPVIVADARTDPRFADNPLVVADPKIRFYAGFPLETPSGEVLGTLCVIDYEPRELTADQLELLNVLSDQVMAQLTLRRTLFEREQELAERQRLIARVAESESRYRTLVESSPDIIARLSPEGRVRYASHALTSVLGLTPETAMATEDIIEQIVHPDDLAHAQQALTEVNAGQRRDFTTRIRRADDGSYRQIEVTLLPIQGEDGIVTELMLVGRDVTDRMMVQHALGSATAEAIRRGNQLEEAQEIAELGSWTVDLGTGQSWWSPQLYRIFGVEPGSVTPSVEQARAFNHPQDRDRVRKATERIRDGGPAEEIEYRILRADGEVRIVQARGRRENDHDGARIVGTIQDITELRQTERELRRARDLFVQVLDSTEHAFIAIDTEGRITLFNRGAERMLGWSAAEVLGTTKGLTWHDPFEMEQIAAELNTPFGLSMFVEHAGHPALARPRTYIAKDGTRRTVSVTMRPMHDGDEDEVTGYIGVVTDVTARVQAEKDRDAQSHMLRAVIQNNQSIITVKDLRGRYLMVNQAFVDAFGIAEADIVGRTDEAIDPRMADRWRANDRRGIDRAVPVVEIADLPDGRHWYDTVRIPLQDEAGETYAICTVALDVTEKRRAEAEKAAAMEAMTKARDVAVAATKAKSAFLATMSHEIRTPMNAVIGMTGLLLETPLNDEQRELLHTVRSSGDQLLAIINDILDFSKIEAGDLDLEEHPFELRECVEGAIAQFAGSVKNIDLVSHVSDDCPAVVVGDVTRLRQVMTNLVSNAIKFTAEGDVLLKVELEHPDDLPDPSAPASWDAESPTDRLRLRFTVADTGIGISKENMGRLFKSFSQVDASTTRLYGGTGLGLAISKAIVEAMAGRLTVTSEVGVGSQFTFGVSLGRFNGPQALRKRPPAIVAGRHVLVVDDNDTNRRILRLQLESYGMTCQDSASPLAALALIGSGVQFDLAILDYAMPVMDGVQLALALRQLPGGKDLPLVLLSSIGRRDRSQEKVFEAVLTKPIRSAALAEALGQVLAPEVMPPAQPAPTIPQPSAPIDNRPVSHRPAPRERDLLNAGKLRILLVEDNEINQKVGRLMLGKLGHTVELANNGAEAVEAVQRIDYDVVLMDMHMPVMDGLEATRAIRAQIPPDRQPHIIAMTASVTKEDRDACADAGMDGYLSKPVRAEDLTDALGGVPLRQT